MFKGNAGGYYAYYTTAMFAGDEWAHAFELELTSVPSGNNITFFGQGSGLYFRITSTNTLIFGILDYRRIQITGT